MTRILLIKLQINSDQSDTVVDNRESDQPEEVLPTAEPERVSIPALPHQTSLMTADVKQVCTITLI